MREDLARKRKNERFSWKWNCKNGIISLFSSNFSSSTNDGIEPRLSDEVLKPLYYIISDVHSDEVDATIASVDDASVERKGKVEETFQQIGPATMRSIALRYSREISSGSKKNWDFKSLLSRFTSSTTINEIETDEMSTIRQLSEPRNTSFDEKASPTTEKTSISQLHKGYHFLRKLRCIFTCFSVKKIDSHLYAEKVLEVNQNAPSKMEVQDFNPDDAEAPRIHAMGVSFAHPVYTGKCHVPADEKNTNTTNCFWAKLESGLSIEIDDYTLPRTKTIVEISTAASWGSGDSSSLYPTDEQSSSGMNLYHGSFDSDVDTPFDEIRADMILPCAHQKQKQRVPHDQDLNCE